jgi:hypothetical protein
MPLKDSGKIRKTSSEFGTLFRPPVTPTS